MRLSDFYYDLPQELIAQKPLEKRDGSRLLCLNRKTHEISHRHFSDILDYFNEGDCLVLNDSRVIPARLYAVRRDTGAVVEIFLLRPTSGADVWECLCKPGKKTKIGTILDIEDVQCEVLDIAEDGNRTIKFTYDGDVTERLKQLGEMPLPPYIHEKLKDANRYQTVYAKYDGSVAAPTAGLHFTQELLEKIKAKGVEIGYVTLHVGLGTFRPVKVDDPTQHKMHSEYYILPQPKVTSAVLKLTMRKEPVCEIKSETMFFKVVRAAFAQRRKTLLNALSSGLSQFDKPALAAVIEDCGFAPTVRGETLDIPGFAAIANALTEL